MLCCRGLDSGETLALVSKHAVAGYGWETGGLTLSPAAVVRFDAFFTCFCANTDGFDRGVGTRTAPRPWRTLGVTWKLTATARL